MAAMAQMQNALRAEIRDLKQKIVSLETAEADNSRLRKELSNIQVSFEDQKAKQELDFFNRLADIERKNNSRVVDLESKLAEHTKHLLGPAQDFKALHGAGKAEELEHKRDLSRNVDSNKHEVDVLQNQLRAVQTKRDELTRRLEEASIELELKDRKLESLGVDVSFDSTSKTSDGVILAEHRSLQRKLQEANERIACLQTGTSTASRMDGEQQRRVEKLERENLRLQSAFQKAEEDRRKHDITVLQLERRNHDLKMCLQKLEIQGQNDDTDTRASYGFTDDGNLEVECQQLHSELQKAKIALDMANLKTEELSYELRKANTANVECSPEVDMLQQQNQSLQIACNRLGGEVDELKNQLLKSGEQNSSLMTEIINVKNLLQSSEQDKKKLCEQLTKYRDSEVGRDLERERTNADRVPSNFHQKKGFDTLPSEKDTTHELLEKVREENRKLNSDVNQLQRKLDNERKLARSLRREFGDLRTSDCTVTSSSSPPMTETLHRKSKPPDGASTRGSVKGIAARFENGGFQAQPEEKIPRTSFSKMDQEEPASLSKQLAESSEEVKRLKRDLETERKQVFELEEELTRQCEINGSLLKEIKDLSLEIEAKRKECTKYFKISLQSKKDHEEIAELTSKLANLSQELTIVSKEKADLDLKHEVSKEKIISLQDQVQNNANDLNRTHSRDKETINRQEEKVKSLESDLAKTLTLVEDLRDKLNSRAEWRSNDHDFDVQNLKSTLEAKENKISQMEREKQQIVMSMKSMTGFRKEEIEELQIELARLKSKNKEQAREMELLRDQPGQGHFNLHSTANSDENTASLRAENIDLRQKLVEATAERQHAETKLKQYLNDRGGCSKSVQILRERNAALKFEVEKLTKKLSKLHGDKMQVTRVMI